MGQRCIWQCEILKKPFRISSPEQEREVGFERIQADLEDPESVHVTVTKSGAKRALVYLVWKTPRPYEIHYHGAQNRRD
jgi:hypothetical protein